MSESLPSAENGLPVERDLWWGYLCPALANIGALKEAQRDLVVLGTDWAEAGRILSRVQSFYVDAAHQAARRYLDAEPPVTDEEVEAAARGVHAHQEYSTCWDDEQAGATSRMGTEMRPLGEHGRTFYRGLARAALAAVRAADRPRITSPGGLDA